MQKINIILVIISLTTAITFAQEEDDFFNNNNEDQEIKTLFGTESHGGFGAVNVMYSEINDEDAIFIGGRGGWIIGHGLSIGLGGGGYFSNPAFNVNDIKYNLAGGHGGMYIEPIILPKFPVHLTLPIFIGAGGISYIEYENNQPPLMEEGNAVETKSYFIAEPGAELELNMLRHFRMSFGVYYTYTSSINFTQVDIKDPLSNLKFGVSFKFGKF